MIALAEFAKEYRLRTKHDACGDPIVVGKLGHIAEHGNRLFSIVLEDTTSGPSRARTLLNRRRKALAAGFHLHQAGEAESVLLFDPANVVQAKAAIALVRAATKRLASEAQLANLRKPLGRAAFQSLGAADATSHYTPTTTHGNEHLPTTEAPNSQSGRA